MYFNSHEFILFFLPIVLIGYYILGRTKKQLCHVWLLLCSIVFYLYFSISMSLVILFSMILNYTLYSLILRKRHNQTEKCKKICAIGIILNVLILFVFKYASVYSEYLSGLKNISSIVNNIVVPVGISFFTFSQISLLVDTYRGDFGECTLVDYSLYILLFIKVLSGPLVSANELISQFHDDSRKKLNYMNFCAGLYAFAFGLAKKVLLADFLSIITDTCYGNVGNLSGFEALITIFAYAFQLYFDFSGYCDMATGIGLMLNLEIPQNFNSPYQATDIVDFWSRWHITLTDFLTKYIYFPLGGSKKGKVRQYLNIFIVFTISGIWHGAGLTFLVWSSIHGVLNIISHELRLTVKRTPKVISVAVTFLLTTIAWVFFRANSVTDAVTIIIRPFIAPFGSFNEDLIEAMLQPVMFSLLNRIVPFGVAVVLVILFCAAIVFFMKNTNDRIKGFKPTWGRALVTIILLCFSTLSLTGFSSFIYGGF